MPDLARVSAELDLEQAGKDRGARNEPVSTATALDSVELRSVQHIERIRDEAEHQHAEMQDAQRGRLADLNFDAVVGTISTVASTGIGAIHTEVEKGKDELASSRKDMLRAERHLADFRREHQLGNRTARYARTFAQAFLRWSVLALLVIIEALINGLFFQQGSTAGLVGGIAIAAGFALLNIGFAFIAGRVFLPLLPRREPWLKAIGGLALACYAVGAILLNLLIAHYRMAFGIDALHPESIALGSFRAAPLAGLDVLSLTLFATGVLFALISAFDSWTMGDSYFGYGGVTRDYDRRRDDYMADRAQLLDAVQTHYQDAGKSVSGIVETFSRKRSEISSIHKAIPRLSAHFVAHLSALEQFGNDLLAIYRDANQAARTTPPPAHFGQAWQMARPASATTEHPHYDDAAIEHILEEAKVELRLQLSRLDEAYTNALEVLRSLDALDQADGE